MNLSTRVLGTTTVKYLSDRLTQPVLRIGSDRFLLADLAGVGCFNFMAARTLNRVLNVEFQVKDTRDLFTNVAPSALVVPLVGPIAFAVLGAAFEVKGLGGDRPLEAWVIKHRYEHARREFLTVSTLKQQQRRDVKAAANERRAKKRRTSARRDQAHRLRVDRLNARQTSSP